jgi:hypothetical protein
MSCPQSTRSPLSSKGTWNRKFRFARILNHEKGLVERAEELSTGSMFGARNFYHMEGKAKLRMINT